MRPRGHSEGHTVERSALVVGGGSDLAVAIARELVRRGVKTSIAGIDREIAEADAASIGPGAVAVGIDVTDFASCERATSAANNLAPLTYLVNCAGLGTYAPLLRGDPAEWRRCIEVNLLGNSHVIAAAARVMAETAERTVPCAIVTISSLNARLPVAGYSTYCAAKAGVEALTAAAALELAPNIRINAIAPGPIQKQNSLFSTFPAFLDALRAQHPLGNRLASAADIVPLALFLLEEGAQWITGQTIVVDGGVGLNFGTLPFD